MANMYTQSPISPTDQGELLSSSHTLHILEFTDEWEEERLAIVALRLGIDGTVWRTWAFAGLGGCRWILKDGLSGRVVQNRPLYPWQRPLRTCGEHARCFLQLQVSCAPVLEEELR